MTSAHYEMLVYLAFLARSISEDSTQKKDLVTVNSGSETINSYLKDIANAIDFGEIKTKIVNELMPEDYKDDLIFSLEKIYKNESFDADEVFDTYNN